MVLRRRDKINSTFARQVARLAGPVVAAGVAFTASHFPSFDIITASFASPKDDVRKTDPLDVANSPKLSAFLSKLNSVSFSEIPSELHNFFKVGGELGLKTSAAKFRQPKTASELAETPDADCSDAVYGVAAVCEALGRDDIKCGAVFGHVKGAAKTIDHIVPFVLVKGSHPNGDTKFKSKAMAALGASGEWTLIILDPQSAFGKTVDFDRFEAHNSNKIKGDYFRELGHYYYKGAKPQDLKAAVESYKVAVELNPNDNESRGAAIEILGSSFQRLQKMIAKATKPQLEETRDVIKDLLFFLPNADPQKASLERSLGQVEGWLRE